MAEWNKFRWAGMHNYTLRQVIGARTATRTSGPDRASLTPRAIHLLTEADRLLAEAEKEIRQHRVEPDGSLWTRPEDKA